MIGHELLLSVKGIQKSFGTTRAVDEVSFDVKRGEIFGLLGPNGAGKTTTIRMLMGITVPDQGVVEYNLKDFRGGLNLNESREATQQVRKRVGYLPEERGIYQSTKVLETIIYMGQLKGMNAHRVKKKGMEWLVRLGLKAYAGKKLEELSKGMQQKVQFIISMIHQPEFVVLDELFAGLDPVNQDLFKEIVRSLAAEGMTVLLSSHRMNMVEELCDRIFLINKGQQVLYGTVDEIKENFGEEKVTLKYQGDDSFLHRHKDIVELVARSGYAEFYLSSEITPDQFIRQIPESLQIREISVQKPPLHDIFVRTVKEGS